MNYSVLVIAGLVAADAVVNIAACLLGKRQAKVDKDLTDALMANRDAVMKRNELLELEVKSLKTLVEMISQKQDKEKEEKERAEDKPNV